MRIIFGRGYFLWTILVIPFFPAILDNSIKLKLFRTDFQEFDRIKNNPYGFSVNSIKLKIICTD